LKTKKLKVEQVKKEEIKEFLYKYIQDGAGAFLFSLEHLNSK